MKRKMTLIVLLFMIFILFISACSSNDSNQNSADKDSMESTESARDDMDYNSGSFTEQEEQAINDTPSEISESVEINTNRMIIHTANLQLRVKDFNKTLINIENKVNEHGGYVVESNVYRENDKHISGNIVVRMPEKHFQSFLVDTEEKAVEVLERNVSGQDVTEQYVDLESRLKSKRVVEERLLTFMSDAEKTEDLLKISNDLATVQEEIEVIVGKMNYLENQSAFSTIKISMHENRIIIPELENKDLDTWEKTKKQLATSLNFLLAAGSGFIVFFIGNLPVIILLLIISGIIYFGFKNRKKIE